MSGSVGLGESYADGWWDADDLTALLRVLARNVRRTDGVRRAAHRLSAPVTDPLRRLRRQDLRRDKDDVRAHYDLGNDFFERLLDETMMYSSAVFPSAEATLREGSVHKLDLLCQRIGLGPGDHVLEIGTGWGGFAIHAAQHYGCRVTTTTISDRQFEYARDRVRAAGLDGQITVLDRDYRDLEGTFDADRVDRNDRGSRLAGVRRLLPQLRGAASPRTVGSPCRPSPSLVSVSIRPRTARTSSAG